MAQRIFKKSTDFKATNESAAQDKGAMVQGKLQVVDGALVFVLPLNVTEDMIRLYTEPVERNGATQMVDKGSIVVVFDIPEGLEVTVQDWAGGPRTFKVKRGGNSAKRYITLGFDPNAGYMKQPDEDQATEQAA